MKPSLWIEKVLTLGRAIIPKSIFRLGQPAYHYSIALLAAIRYRFPGRSLKIVMITGTKGKTSTAELINAVLNEAGYKTALSSTIRINIADTISPNLYKMTTPGRFFLQKFLREAVKKKCEWAVIEMTSQAIVQYRHCFIDFDALVFTNIAPEHIESHGSFDKYLAAKLKLTHALQCSPKRPRISVSNLDDPHGEKFFLPTVEKRIGFKLSDPFPYQTELQGNFNKLNILAAASFARAIGIAPEKIKLGIEKVRQIPGRVDYVNAGQLFKIVVDYATTPDSLVAFYKIFSGKKLICVLGSTGGGRDKWKRPIMGGIADEYCERVILTNEDPYDEDPSEIIDQIADGMVNTSKMEKIIDRRLAIRRALEITHSLQQTYNEDDMAILITGRGTDPYMTGFGGIKQLWSDKQVAEEEFRNLKK